MSDPHDTGAIRGADRVRELIERSADATDLESLQKRGFKNVRVIDERRIQELVAGALDQVIAERSRHYLAEERQQLSREAMDEFQDLMRDHQDSVSLQQELAGIKSRIQGEYDDVAARITARLGGEEQSLDDLRAQFAKLMGLLQEKDGQLFERTRELALARRKLSKALDQAAQQSREIEELRAGGAQAGAAHEAFERELATLRAERDALEKNSEDAAQALATLSREGAELRRQVADSEQRLLARDRAAKAESATLRRAQEELQRRLEEAEARTRAVAAELQAARAAQDDLRAQLTVQGGARAALAQKLDERERAHARTRAEAERAGLDLTRDHRQQLAASRARVRDLAGKLQGYRGTVEQLGGVLESLFAGIRQMSESITGQQDDWPAGRRILERFRAFGQTLAADLEEEFREDAEEAAADAEPTD